MKAEERKEMDNPSFSNTLDSIRQNIGGRTLYYILGTVALVVAAVLLWNYFTGQSSKAKDARLLQLEGADTTEKLKSTMEDFRGTPLAIWPSYK